MYYQQKGLRKKFILLIVFSYAINICNAQDTINTNNTISIINVKYIDSDTFYVSKRYTVDDNQPITGIVVDSFILGNTRHLTNATLYSNGVALMNTIFYPNGKIKMREYYLYSEGYAQGDTNTGKIYNGPYIEYYENGNKKTEGIYTMELKDKKWLYYNFEGKLLRIDEWNRGILINSIIKN
jgi:antitoxin component YwqK of YwqJK toxin-antitoxin module